MSDKSCCSAQVSLIPAPQNYSSGLSALTQRRNDYAQALQRMVANIPQYAVDPNQPDNRPLAALTSRESNDPAMAFLDAWAVVLDVLDFYQVRHLNEYYLRTATEQRSVLELARAIGYELSPGVAASAWLAFTVDTATGSPASALIPAGTPVQSTPSQNLSPQQFETQQGLTAIAELNTLYPYQSTISVAQTITATEQTLLLATVTARLQVGDAILLMGIDEADIPHRFLLTLSTVTTDNVKGITTITWHETIENIAFPLQNLSVFSLTQVGAFGHTAPLYVSMLADVKDSSVDWDKTTPTIWQNPNLKDTNAMDSSLLNYKIYKNADFYLDQKITQILPSNWIILSDPLIPQSPVFYQVDSVHTESLAGYGMSGTVTGLTLQNPDKTINFGFRTTAVYVQHETLTLSTLTEPDPRYTPVTSNIIYLDKIIESLQVGQKLILNGTSIHQQNSNSEVVTIAGITRDLITQYTVLTLEKVLEYSYEPASVTIYGNVVQATHGTTTTEVIGSGDGSIKNQRFTLKKSPLTYLPAANRKGIAGTLQIRVNGILWEEVPNLYEQAPNSQVYMIRQNEAGATTITFGDGVNGARLPTGTENVQATYRVGLGPAGEVPANAISLLLNRPFGIKSVINPMSATGAAAPEDVEAARRHAPLTVVTLGRIVSLQDYDSYVQAYTGISNAQAVALTQGQRPLVYVTVAGVNGANIPTSSLLYTDLQAAIKAVAVPGQTVVIGSYEALYFTVQAHLLIDSRYQSATVLASANSQLQQTFSFAKRNFTQNVAASDVIKTLQNVPGVLAVTLSAFCLSTDAATSRQPMLNALPARVAADNVSLLPAQLLMVNVDSINLTEIKQ